MIYLQTYSLQTDDEADRLKPSSLSKSGLTFGYCTHIIGGYCRFNNVVIIHIRISNSSDVRNRKVNGFPNYNTSSYNYTSLSAINYNTMIPVGAVLDKDGNLEVYDTTDKGEIITGFYLCK